MATAMRASLRASTARVASFKPAARVVASRPAARRLRIVAKAGEETVPSAYANALLELGQSKNVLEPIHADMDALAALVKDNASLKEFILNPVIADANKKQVFERIGKEAGFNPFTLNFLNLLMEKGRLDMLEPILEAFEKEYCNMTDTQVATVRSAVKLEQEQQFLIAKKLQELTGSKNVKVKPVLDESLIAGFTVEYGSAQIDLSIKGQLEKITNELYAKYSDKAAVA
jgi:F-type H+-transporting ATPase subunit delta